MSQLVRWLGEKIKMQQAMSGKQAYGCLTWYLRIICTVSVDLAIQTVLDCQSVEWTNAGPQQACFFFFLPKRT